MTMGNQLSHFERTVEELVKKQQNKIIFDMSQITYLDSSSIGVLVGCNSIIGGSGGSLRLACVTDRVGMILKMTGLDGFLPCDPSREAAVQALTAGH